MKKVSLALWLFALCLLMLGSACAAPKTFQCEFTGYAFTDGTTELTPRMGGSEAVQKYLQATFPNDGDIPAGVTLQWSIVQPAQGEVLHCGEDWEWIPYEVDYQGCTPAKARSLIGKPVVRCVIQKGQETDAVIDYVLSALVDAPTDNRPYKLAEYLYYTPNEPMTLTLDPVPTIGSGSIIYKWYLPDRNFRTTDVPSVTFTPTADYHRRSITCFMDWASRPEHGFEKRYQTEYILIDSTRQDGIRLPDLNRTEKKLDLPFGQSLTLSAQPATAPDGKKVVYTWGALSRVPLQEADYWELEPQSEPTLVLSNIGTIDPKNPLRYYTVSVSFEDGSGAMEYPLLFIVNYLPPATQEEVPPQRLEKNEVWVSPNQDQVMLPSPLSEDNDFELLVIDLPVLKEVSPTLKEALAAQEISSPEALEMHMLKALKLLYTALNPTLNTSKTVDVTLSLYNTDTGVQEVLTPDRFPREGVMVTLPYPKGTSPEANDFVVAHMFGESTPYHSAGAVEYPKVIKTPNGLCFTLMGTSPVTISWYKAGAANFNGPPHTGVTSRVGILCLLMAASLIGIVAVLMHKRRKP